MPIWNKQVECLPRDELRAQQGASLKDCVSRVYHNVKPYASKMDSSGVSIGDINSIDDITKLPFTLKQDLRDAYPYGFFAVPMKDVVRVHASSGTTGKQTVVGYTKKDIITWSESMARTLAAAGADSDSIVQIAYGYGLFTGGLGAHYGAEYLGATAIPVSGGNTGRQLEIMQDFMPTLLACTPSYALYLAESLEAAGIDVTKLSLKSGVFGAEPWTDEMRKEIERGLNIKAYDIYGLSEIIGPGVAYECDCQSGLHVNEDFFYPEVIDPDTLQPLPDGTEGELVFTCLTKEALPLIRYRTRDITKIIPEPCACGRTSRRIRKPRGRTDDMLIIRGVNVFPSQIESVLLDLGGTLPHYMIIVDRVNNLDQMTIQVEITSSMLSDTVRELEVIEKRIFHAMQSKIGINATIQLVEPRTIARSEGKAKRVIDNRK